MPKMVTSVPASMLNFLDVASRHTGLARSEIVRGCIMNDPRYKEYIKNLTKNRSTTVVEPAKNVSVSREPDPDRAIGYEESKAAWLLEQQDREAEREYQRELKREPTPEELAMDEEWEREQRKNQGTDDVK